MMTPGESLRDTSFRIFNEAYEAYKPVAVFLLTSGGNDSIVPLHLFKDDPRITAAMHIDTGIRVPQTEDHVRKVCKDFGLNLLVYRASENTKADGTPDPQLFEEIVKTHGFPGPSQHRIMYSKLKERQVRRLVRDYKQEWGDKIMLVTGVRKSESRRRMGTVSEVQTSGAQVWVAPITHWEDSDMSVYRAHYQLPKNPVSEALGMSGECLCGAYARPGELAKLELAFPETAAYIRKLEKDSKCPWGWEGHPSRAMSEVFHADDDDMPLCTNCISKARA